jgi:7,8-dihydropterin-6-yl-methyl-4-(beta-D-ribofuranosyl)aminobenzene 5'-phosphate synthase
MIRVTVLVENTAEQTGLLAEHGLAIWVEGPSRRVLFDTGQSTVALTHNADVLDIDLSCVDVIALSHGHYDHTGGLAAVLAAAPGAGVVIHPQARATRYSQHADGRVVAVGMPANVQAALDAHAGIVRYERATFGLGDGVWLTGVVPRTHASEHGTDGFFLDKDCTQPDALEDDQSLFFDTRDGVVVLLGCAHSGVVNTLTHIRALTDRPLAAAIGGMHLRDGNTSTLRPAIDTLRRLTPRLLVPLHCTSFAARVELANALPGYTHGAVGTMFEFET